MNNELIIWERINACKTVEQLKTTIIELFPTGVIPGRSQPFSVGEMNELIDVFAAQYKAGNGYTHLPTRRYGIRQQLLFILVNPTR